MKRKSKRLIQKIGTALIAAIFTTFLLPVFFSLLTTETVQVGTAVGVEQMAQSQPLTLTQTGQAQYKGEQYLSAAQTLQQAADAYAADGDMLRQAQTLGLQALAWQKLGKWNRAQLAIEQGLQLLDGPRSDGSERDRIQAQIISAQAQLQRSLGRSEEALESWVAAERLYRQVNASEGVLGSQINQAQVLQSLGLYRRAEQILEQLEKTLRTELSVVEGSASGLQSIEPSLRARGLLTLGNSRRLGGEIAQSQAILEDGLAIAQQLQQPQLESEALVSLGSTERILAKQARSIKEDAESLKYGQSAQAHYQQAQRLATSATTRVQAQLSLLSLLIETEQMTEAENVRSQIIQALPDLPVSRAAVYARVNLAQKSIEIAPEEAPAIAERLATAIQQASQLEDNQAESYALGTLGMLYEEIGDIPNAQTVTKAALSKAKLVRAPDIAYQWQWQMGRLLQASSGNATAVPEAVEYYTAAVNTLADLRSDLIALNPDIQFSFRERVEPVYRQLVNLLLLADEPTQAQLRQARDVMEALQLAELDNFFRDACAQPVAIDIDTVDTTAAVFYPIVLEDRLAVILKLPGDDNLRYYATDETNAEQLDRQIEQLLEGLRRRRTAQNELKAQTQQLYRWLIEPFATELEPSIARSQSNIKTLVFVLDGSLRNVPMSTLYDGEHYLIERYAIALTPGLQLLAPKGLQRDSLRVLLAGAASAPSFEAQNLRDLENAPIEIDRINAIVDSSIELEDERFLQSAIRENIEKNSFDIVHLATHGNFSSNPDRTFLLDWNSRISANDIDTLFQVENPLQEQPVELLVLSACETAYGDNRAVLGLAGIAIRADVRSTLATLWQVNDASTAEFMARFYQQLSTGTVTKAEALRNTQIAFLKEYERTDYNRPFHWAPFTLVGNWL